MAVTGAVGSVVACASTAAPFEPEDGGTAFDGDPVADAATRRDSGKKPADLDDSSAPDESEEDAAPDSGVVGPQDAGKDAPPPVDCGPPGQVFTSPLGPFCPFQAGGTFSNCAVGEHCCQYAEVSATPSTCSAGPTACAVAITTGFDWRCDETNDCPGGQICCFAGIITPHPQCSGLYSASPNVHATACRPAACAAGETRTCGSTADCPAGQTCTGMRLRGKHFGFCRP